MFKLIFLFLPFIFARRTLWPIEELKRNLLDEEFYDRETMPLNFVYEPLGPSADFRSSICGSWMRNIYEFYSQSSYDELSEAEKNEDAFYEFYCEDDALPGADFDRFQACQEYIRIFYFDDANATASYEQNGGKCLRFDGYEMEAKVQEMLENLMFRAKFTPLEVDAGIEIQSINEVKIHESSMDSTIIIYLSWSDPRLIWSPKDNNQIFSIYVPSEKIWTPPFEIVNLDHYLNFGIIFKYDAKISNSGDVSSVVKMRVSTSCDITQKLYPFDLQECSVEIATPNLDTELLNFKINTWNSMQKGEIAKGSNETNYNETDLDSVKNTFFDDNPEWKIAAFKYEVSNSANNINQNFSKLSTTFFLQRQIAFYEITLLLPIVCLNILVCVGLWIPISSGENISYQVTMLLTIVVYLEVLSSSIPVFSELAHAPQLLILFIISIIASVAAMIILAGNAWLQDKQYDQMYCFSRGRARFAFYSAKFYEKLHGDRYLIPEVILKCLKHKIENSKERLAINLEMKKSSDMDPDDWNIAWRFYGKMISHFCAICLTLCVSVASLSVVITIHMKNNTGKENFQTSP